VDVSAYPNVFFVKDKNGEVIKVIKQYWLIFQIQQLS
jgi:hypothetical protein